MTQAVFVVSALQLELWNGNAPLNRGSLVAVRQLLLMDTGSLNS